jgi:hypothetical protein
MLWSRGRNETRESDNHLPKGRCALRDPRFVPEELEVGVSGLERSYRRSATRFLAASPPRSCFAVVVMPTCPASCCIVARSAPASRRAEMKLRRRSCGLNAFTPARRARFNTTL